MSEEESTIEEELEDLVKKIEEMLEKLATFTYESNKKIALRLKELEQKFLESQQNKPVEPKKREDLLDIYT